VIRILVADGLILAAGNGLVTVVAGPSRRVFGVAGRLGVSFLAGVSLLATVTTVLAVLGLPTTPPATAPLLVVAALVGALPLFVPGALSPLRQRFQAPYRPLLQLGGELLAAVPALWIGLKAVAGGAKIPVVVSDEYAIWALRGRMLSSPGTSTRASASTAWPATTTPTTRSACPRWSPGPTAGWGRSATRRRTRRSR
jgi:hypothetical protein